MYDDQHRLLDSLEQARSALRAATQYLDERTAASTIVFGEWTIKDLLAHLIAWGDELRSEISQILVHPAPRYDYVISEQDDYDQWNQDQVAHKRDLSLAGLLAEIERDYRQTADLIRRLAPGQLGMRGVVPWRIQQLPAPQAVTPETSMTVASLLEIHIRHLHEHAGDIQRLGDAANRPAQA